MLGSSFDGIATVWLDGLQAESCPTPVMCHRFYNNLIGVFPSRQDQLYNYDLAHEHRTNGTKMCGNPTGLR